MQTSQNQFFTVVEAPCYYYQQPQQLEAIGYDVETGAIVYACAQDVQYPQQNVMMPQYAP